MLGRKPEKLEKLGSLLNQSVYSMTCCTHSDTPQKSFCWTPPPKFDAFLFLDEWKDLSIHTEGWRFFCPNPRKTNHPNQREVFIFKTNSTLHPPKKNQISTIIYHLTAPHFFKFFPPFPQTKTFASQVWALLAEAVTGELLPAWTHSRDHLEAAPWIYPRLNYLER